MTDNARSGPRPPLVATAIQATILFSTALGAVFVWVARGLLPPDVYAFILTGWMLFLIDSALTFVRPRISYYLGFVLSLLALSSSLPQSAHYAFIEEGQVLPASIFVAGSIAQAVLLALTIYYIVTVLRRGR